MDMDKEHKEDLIRITRGEIHRLRSWISQLEGTPRNNLVRSVINSMSVQLRELEQWMKDELSGQC